jgi:tetratricopeptide (TPR) repeat protein
MSAPLRKICIVCRREFPEFVVECPDDRVRLSEKDTRIGTIFDGKYEILDFIGAGGLSRVYRARHTELNRIIALKVLRSLKLVDLQRFRREAVSFAKLEHPNIAKVYAFSVSPDGCPYLAMEYLEGRDLSSYVAREGPLSVPEALSIFEQACAALEHAHSQSIIHRDIKPSNIVLLSQFEQPGSVKVVDFGMAKLLRDNADSDQRITQEGEIFGTRQYISPEQYRGNVCDERADIYALGVSMYESVLNDGKIPELLQTIINKATEADPQKRYQTAREFKSAISTLREAILTGSSELFKIAAADKKTVDVFGTFYFWTMIVGMICFSIAAGVVIKQRMNLLDTMSPKKVHESILTKKPLSFAATETQTTALSQAGRYDEALVLWQKWFERNQNADWHEMVMAKKHLALSYQRLGQDAKAVEILLDAKRIFEEHHAESTGDFGDLINTLAICQMNAGQYDASIETSKSMFALGEPGLSKRGKEQEIYANLAIGRAYFRKGDLAQAEKYDQIAIDSSLQDFGKECSSYAEAQSELASIDVARKNYKTALERIDKSIACYDSNSCKYELQLFDTYASKAQLLMNLKDNAELDKLYQLMKERLAHSKQPTRGSQVLMHKTLASIAKYLGRNDEAKKWLEN